MCTHAVNVVLSYSNFKLNLRLRRPPTEYDLNILMEDNLKKFKVEYLSNHLLNHTQILNLSLNYQTIFCKSIKLRRPPMEDDIKILKVEYLSNHLLDHTQILNLSLYNQTIFCKSFK